MPAAPETAREAIAGNSVWYHTIELAPGVVTPGQVDLRGIAPRLLPADLSGKRALDVGTFDGFWAYEMERRGAEVVAIDVESIDAAQWPPMHRAGLQARAEEWQLKLGRGFELASGLLESSVERVVCDVMELEPDAVGGPFDLVFSGAILLHLRDPVGALERIAATLAPGGEWLALEPFSVWQTLVAPRRPVAHFQPLVTEFNWWYPNVATLRAWPRAAGLGDVRGRGFYRLRATRLMRSFAYGVSAVRR